MHPEELVGQTLGHYKIKRQIGYGGMSTVFLADDIHLAREVALKVFWPRPGETQDFLRRFIREARVLAQLDHPNILPVYDYGEQGSTAFLVTPYLAGGTLKDLLQKRRALPPSEALRLVSQVLPALQYAHDRNLIHRDIKPGNLLFKVDGSVVLADFGLVKVLEGDGREGMPLQTISETGLHIAGTPEYMPPEQIDGHAVPASDIYSLGMVLYEMTTGSRPFRTTNLLSMLMKQANEAVQPPRELNPSISPQLEAAILKALEKDPARRFARPADFLQALQQPNSPPVQDADANTLINDNAAKLTLPHEDVAEQRTLNQENALAPTWPSGDYPGSTPNRPLSTDKQGSPATPKVGNSQPGIDDLQYSPHSLAPQPPSQPGMPQAGHTALAPQTPQIAQAPQGPLQQAWSPLQTIAPPFVPRQPRHSSRTPLLVLVLLCVLLAGIVATIFLTSLGPRLLGHAAPTPPPGRISATPGGTPPVRGIHTVTPVGTQTVSGASTTCPANNTARAAEIAPLILGDDPTLVSITNRTNPDGSPASGTLSLFDTANGQQTNLVTINQTEITEAQISDDGQWVLFSALVAGQSELRLVRLDGQGQQTLLCAPGGTIIKSSQWSIDQRYIVLDEFPSNGEPTVYLLNTQTGQLQVEITAPTSGPGLVARTWLDNTRVLMVGVSSATDTSPQNIYILNLSNGANQNPNSLAPVFVSNQACWDFDSSYDGETLFIAQCVPGTPVGSSTVSQQSATGGTLRTIMHSNNLAFKTVRVIDSADSKLLALAENTSNGDAGARQRGGLYVINTNGTGNPRRLASASDNAEDSLNPFSQYFWSNISRDTTMYALTTTEKRGNSAEYSLAYGRLSGGTPNIFAQDDQYMAIVGWTTT